MILHPWPLNEAHATLNESLEIALDYLVGTGQAHPYSETQVRTADAILLAWRAGARHPIRLANVGIMAVQRARATQPTESAWSFFPLVS